MYGLLFTWSWLLKYINEIELTIFYWMWDMDISFNTNWVVDAETFSAVVMLICLVQIGITTAEKKWLAQDLLYYFIYFDVCNSRCE